MGGWGGYALGEDRREGGRGRGRASARTERRNQVFTQGTTTASWLGRATRSGALSDTVQCLPTGGASFSLLHDAGIRSALALGHSGGLGLGT